MAKKRDATIIRQRVERLERLLAAQDAATTGGAMLAERFTPEAVAVALDFERGPR